MINAPVSLGWWTESMSKSAVFLDRDGTINHEVNYVSEVSQLALIEGAAQGIHQFNRAGLAVVVVTNQAGIARGLLTEASLQDIHRVLESELSSHDAFVDAIYYCPHHPTEGNEPYRRACDCRKPGAGMLRRAAEELKIELTQSYVVGDKLSDLQAGQSVGCRTILVRTGYGKGFEQQLENDDQLAKPDFIADDLLRASEWILDQHSPCSHS
jgi:D-glycero-D-manno-heptose 1,7-bisphosphate phosphatase